jgi:hypothetical protein
MTNIAFDKEKEILTAYTGQLLAFIEDEVTRIYEERNGAYRKDGGRVVQAKIFLDKILQTERTRIAEEVEEKLECIGNPQGFSESATWSKGAKEAYEEVLSIIKQRK